MWDLREGKAFVEAALHKAHGESKDLPMDHSRGHCYLGSTGEEGGHTIGSDRVSDPGGAVVQHDFEALVIKGLN